MRRRLPEPPPPLTDDEAFAILEEPIEQAVLRGEAVVLAPYAEKLFALMASWMPKVKPPPRGLLFVTADTIATPLRYERTLSFTPYTGASAVYGAVSAGLMTVNEARSMTTPDTDSRAELKAILEKINK